LLDDPFLGLDAAGRAELGAWLQVGQPTAPTVLFTAHPAEVPAWATQVVAVAPVPTVPTGPPVIELRKVRVRYGSRLILDDVTWIVRASERWALVGPNGAGKSTLLALVAGDHPQAYANDVALFGQRRGAGATIWELKQRLGLVSAELHVYFAEPLSVAQVVASGWHDGLVPRALTPAQTAGVAATLAEFGLTHLAERGWRTLSTGEQRLALFARAVVKRPEVLILDEPFQSLDMAWIARLRGWLDTHLQPTQTLLFVTHVPTEVPTSVRHVARLHNGQLSVG
jgi:molybdate transport system ATP-binding protein